MTLRTMAIKAAQKSKRIILIPNAVIRKKDLIYFVDRDGNLCASPKRKGRKPGSRNKHYSK